MPDRIDVCPVRRIQWQGRKDVRYFMTQVTTQTELENAIIAEETDIRVAADFDIDALQTIRYTTAISSAAGGSYTLTRAGGYNDSMFQIAGGTVTFTNIILDGAKAANPASAGPLLWVPGGGVILEDGAVLQNNRGPGIYRNETNGNDIIIRGNAVIRSNEVTGDGGGIHVTSGGNLLVSGQARIENNTCSGRGGGICYDAADSQQGGRLVISENAVITGNTAAGNGGGIYADFGYCSITGNAQISKNQAANGGGIYHGDEAVLVLTGVTFSENTAADNGQDVCNIGSLELGETVASPNGIFFESLAAAPVIIQHLTADSVVQLEASGYVTPNPEGTPIVAAQSDLDLTAADAAAFRTPAAAGFAGWGPRLHESGRQIVLEPVVYALRYENTMGAENPNPPDYTVLTPTITLLPLASTPEYRFAGWFNALEGGVQVTEIPLGSTEDKTLYARWLSLSHTLTYYGNDAGGPAAQNVPGPVPVTGGQSVTLSSTIPTRENFIFSGWNTDPAGTGTAYRPGDTIPDVQTDISLYAQWIPLPSPTFYTLTYYGNDAGGPPARCVPCPEKVWAGGCARISCCRPGRCCYAFTGWNTSPYGTGQTYWPGQPIGPVMENICLFAQWKRLPPCSPVNPGQPG